MLSPYASLSSLIVCAGQKPSEATRHDTMSVVRLLLQLDDARRLLVVLSSPRRRRMRQRTNDARCSVEFESSCD